MTGLIDDMPAFARYSVGDCEMLPSAVAGGWMQVCDIRELIVWLTDHDDSDVILAKLDKLEEVLR